MAKSPSTFRCRRRWGGTAPLTCRGTRSALPSGGGAASCPGTWTRALSYSPDSKLLRFFLDFVDGAFVLAVERRRPPYRSPYPPCRHSSTADPSLCRAVPSDPPFVGSQDTVVRCRLSSQAAAVADEPTPMHGHTVREVLGAACAYGAYISVTPTPSAAAAGRKRPASGWGSLTPAERDVVRLVSEGLGQQRHRHKDFRVTAHRANPPHPRLHQTRPHLPGAACSRGWPVTPDPEEYVRSPLSTRAGGRRVSEAVPVAAFQLGRSSSVRAWSIWSYA